MAQEKAVIARFRFSRAHRMLVWTGAVLGLAFIGMMIFGLWVSFPPGPFINEWMIFIGGVCLAVYFVCLLHLHWKYRRVYKIHYAISSDGIWTEDHGAESFASWEEVSHAEYMPLVSVFRIQLRQQQYPIVLFTRGPDEFDPQRSGGLAKRLIRDALKEKLKTAWSAW